jgi:hypothetical protein
MMVSESGSPLMAMGRSSLVDILGAIGKLRDQARCKHSLQDLRFGKQFLLRGGSR